MSRVVIASKAARFAGLVGAALVVGAPGRAAAQAAPAGTGELYIAGRTLADDQLVIERVGADGKATELFRGGAPSAWQWRDAHTLIELFDQDAHGDTDIAVIVDGRPDPTRALQIENASWPAEAQGWSQALSVHHGQVWLVRERPPTGTRTARPVAPVFRRVDVTPNVMQREPPDHEIVASTDEPRAWLEHLPSVKATRGAVVTRTKAKIGTQTLGAVQCRPARGAPTTFPSAAIHPFLRIDVAAVRLVSPTLPLYVVSGMASESPDGPRFDTAAFLGCTRDALHTFAWGGGDVFLTIAGAPGGAGFAAGDPRKMQLWMAGREVAKLPVLADPALSGAADAPP